MGDFSAKVGARDPQSLITDVIGPYRRGEINEAELEQDLCAEQE